MSFPTQVDILIAGAGPSGLTLASELARGIQVPIFRVRDRDRATIDSRTGQAIRNTVVQLVGHVPAARKALAMTVSELKGRAA